jgi:AraC-like DNA-binding protein
MIVPPSFLGKRNVIIKRHIKDGYLSELFNRMIGELDSPDEYSQEVINGCAKLFMAHLYRYHVYDSIDANRYDKYSERTIGMNMAVKYIHDNYNEAISLDELARLTNFSKYYFCFLFKEFTGESFREYQTRLRIKKAEEMIRGTDLPITDVAFSCGFNDLSYFVKTFKKYKGVTPRQYRRRFEIEGLW